MGRVRVVDARAIARNIRQTFADRPVEYEQTMPFDWPDVLQNVGDSLAVAYASDKWKPKDARGKRELELYKHLAESRNRALVLPGLLRHEDDTSEHWPVIGPRVSLANLPMPDSFAVLGLFEEANLFLHTGGSDDDPKFGIDGDDGVVRIEVRHGLLGGSKILWSSNRVDDPKNQPFLFVYTEEDGVLMVIVGDKLDIEKDGIVG